MTDKPEWQLKLLPYIGFLLVINHVLIVVGWMQTNAIREEQLSRTKNVYKVEQLEAELAVIKKLLRDQE